MKVACDKCLKVEDIIDGAKDWVYIKTTHVEYVLCPSCAEGFWQSVDHQLPKVVTIPKTGIGDLSDGFHTFNELYHHRCVLFSVICNQNREHAWKSKRHHDGTMYDGMFIVGVDTPLGQCTYHYDLEHWDMFHVEERNFAPEWDGHTPEDVLKRLPSLAERAGDGKPVTDKKPCDRCSSLGWHMWRGYPVNRCYKYHEDLAERPIKLPKCLAEENAAKEG